MTEKELPGKFTVENFNTDAFFKRLAFNNNHLNAS
jgi:hypothetical protein